MSKASPEQWLSGPLKRSMDIALCLSTAGITVPVMAISALALAIQDRRNPFFIQERLGNLEGPPLKMPKLLTLSGKPDSLSYRHGTEKRATPLGKLIRKLHYDESPQVFPVLLGAMSLVGPRPLVESHVQEVLGELSPGEQEAWKRARRTARPGVISPGAYRVFMPKTEEFDRIQAIHDIEYAKNASFVKDLGVIGQTIAFAAADRLRLNLEKKPGVDEAVDLYAKLASSYGVQIKADERAFLGTLFTVSRLIDDRLDNGDKTDPEEALERFLNKGLIDGVPEERSEEILKQFLTLSDVKRQQILRGLEVVKRHPAIREDKDIKSFTKKRAEEAEIFAEMLALPEDGDSPDPKNRVRFNSWLRKISTAGYIFDDFVDLRKDYEQNAVSVPPTIGNRAYLLRKLLWHLADLKPEHPVQNARDVLPIIAARALHNYANNNGSWIRDSRPNSSTRTM